MLKEVWRFLKNPVYIEDDYTLKEKTRVFLKLTLITVCFSLGLAIVLEGITTLVGFNFENHAVSEMFKTYSAVMIFFLAIIVAPLIEELIFRAPLGLFKKSTFFKIAFYISVLLFGLIHIANYPDIEGFYWLIPILVAPQISAGIFLGFIRTKLGLVWSMLLHALHNLILIGPFIIMKLLNIPFE
jgi:membrane protease YdiL (CAAX protease family)